MINRLDDRARRTEDGVIYMKGEGTMETYTTGQVIDILKPGQKAFDANKPVNIWGRDDEGEFYWYLAGGGRGPKVILEGWMLSTKWQLLPQYVTLDEAIEANKAEKTISATWGDQTIYIEPYCYGTKVDWRFVAHGKWAIPER